MMRTSSQIEHAAGLCSPRLAATPFQPHRALYNGHVQTLLSRYCPHRVLALRECEAPVIVDGGPDQTGHEATVRLLGYYDRRRTQGPSQGLVISLHGWEGSSHAVHNLVMADAFVAAGYDVFRLNLRDHGPALQVIAQGLNRGLFLGTLLDEVVTAVRRVAELARGKPVYLVGPSMGGNFALRVAIAQTDNPIPNLRKVVAISPALHPGRSIDRIDASAAFRAYFRRRWLRSMLMKQRIFPDLYNFEPLRYIRRIRAMTDWLIPRYSPFTSADEYFDAYAVTGGATWALRVPTLVITAANDPVIPVADFYALAPSPYLRVQIHPTGGHVGFMDVSSPLHHCLPDLVLAELAEGATLSESARRCDTMPTQAQP